MDTSNSITAAVFFAFRKCPTKAFLLSIGEPAPDAFFTDIQARISSMYKTEVTRRMYVGVEVAEPLDFRELWSFRGSDAIAHLVDCETAIYNFVVPSHEPDGRSQESMPSGTFEPVSFLPWDKPDVSDILLVCFAALALSQVTGILVESGTVIYGEAHRRKTVKIEDHAARARQTIGAIGATCHSGEPPPLVLNRHCAVCDYQRRCRGLAIEGASSVDVVDVGSLEVGFQRTFGKFDGALPEFTKINDAAYWDYHRGQGNITAKGAGGGERRAP